MGSFDGTEFCELVGLHLHILGEKYGKHKIELYNDKLASFRYTNTPQADRIRNDFIKII